MACCLIKEDQKAKVFYLTKKKEKLVKKHVSLIIVLIRFIRKVTI